MVSKLADTIISVSAKSKNTGVSNAFKPGSDHVAQQRENDARISARPFLKSTITTAVPIDSGARPGVKSMLDEVGDGGKTRLLTSSAALQFSGNQETGDNSAEEATTKKDM
ncbi:hypothetical protein NDU88_001412 [Pleurodeles waltl]|uniref:Uncharacterized protein n=1 Tax=Pleurodeles waltl TaxID=8319 RepID=A0AAV7LBC7_PLEWA|nr:hypothetical protein NDU88_001412 [Pleurodeles waltl]